MNSNIEKIEKIITQFETLQKDFHTPRGSLIHTLDKDLADKFIAELEWEDCFNLYVPGILLSQSKLDINFFGQTFQVELWKPIESVSKCEFEDFFGFTYDKITQKREYDPNRVVAQFAKDINPKINVRQLLSSVKNRNWEDEKDVLFDVLGKRGLPVELSEHIFNPLKKDGDQFLRDVLRLMIIGGYVKYWDALIKFKEWFNEQGFNVDFSNISTSSLIFG